MERLGTKGIVSLPGIKHTTDFKIEGLLKKWVWDFNGTYYRYSIYLNPDMSAAYYDFGAKAILDKAIDPKFIVKCRLN